MGVAIVWGWYTVEQADKIRLAHQTCSVDSGGAISNVMFIGNARCFHTMDWYRNAQALLAPERVLFATDLVDSEGHVKLVRDADCIVELYNIDWLLLSRQSRFGDLWRNAVKTLTVPLQVWRTRRLARIHARRPNFVFHAHAMYYLWVCWLAGVKYVATPQGSEVLVRPKRSRLYKYFASRALAAAEVITVDSTNMQSGIMQLCGKKAIVVQNGIDLSAIAATARDGACRRHVVSIRGLYPNYRIHRILEGRDHGAGGQALTFIYPFWEEAYKESCFKRLRPDDRDLGRLPRQPMYELLMETLMVVSIPESDSSPRSVYESIFCGCCVAVTPNPWIEALPSCMQARVHIVDLQDADWFLKAVAAARTLTAAPYRPSEAALDLFDQKRSLERVARLCYGVDTRVADNRMPQTVSQQTGSGTA